MDTYEVTTTGEDVTPILGPGLQAALDQALADTPSDKRGNVQLRVTLRGVETAVGVKILDNLEASGFWQWRKGGGQTLGARLKWVF